MSRTFHVCLDVRGWLKHAKFPADYKVMLKHTDGRSMTPDEARDSLMDALASGYEVLPTSTECGNPCAMAGCTGFDRAGGGCPGYER